MQVEEAEFEGGCEEKWDMQSRSGLPNWTRIVEEASARRVNETGDRLLCLTGLARLWRWFVKGEVGDGVSVVSGPWIKGGRGLDRRGRSEERRTILLVDLG